MYRISVHHNMRQTKILAKRFDEIKINENNCQIILNAFPEIMHYDVPRWGNPLFREGEL